MSMSAFAPARRSSISRTLLGFTLLLVILLSLTLTTIGAVLSYQSLLQYASGELSSTADLKEGEIARWTEERESDLAVLAADTSLQQYLETMLESPTGSHGRLAAYSEVAIRLSGFLRKKVAFIEISLLDKKSGQVLVSTEIQREGESYPNEQYFIRGQKEPYLHPPAFDPTVNATTILIARPVQGPNGELLAVLLGRANLNDLGALIQVGTGPQRSGDTYLVSSEGFYVAGSIPLGEVPAEKISSVGIQAALSGEEDVGRYANFWHEEVFGAYRWLPKMNVALLVEQEAANIVASARRQTLTMVIISLGAFVLALAAALLLTRRIVHPIVELTEAATAIAGGDLQRTAPEGRADELGILAHAFNNMTAQLRDLISNLEQRIAERTRDLELRSTYLQASAETGQTIAAVLDPGELARRVVDLIREKFDLYYVGLFELDGTGEWAVLKTGTGEAGQAMLARGHRIQVGSGMVGWSIAHEQPRIAQQAELDDVRLRPAELPETRSEAALPLRSRGQVLGALTIQSDRPNAFDPDNLAIFQIMADQAAIALDNARLFAQSQESLVGLQQAYRERTGQEWEQLLRIRQDFAYRSDGKAITSASDIWRPEMEKALQTGKTVADAGDDEADIHPLAVPIKIRENVIGVLRTHKTAERGHWTEDEIGMLESIGERIGMALESARLYQDTQRRATRERLVSEITTKIRSTTDPQAMIETALAELRKVLDASQAQVVPHAPPPEADKPARKKRAAAK